MWLDFLYIVLCFNFTFMLHACVDPEEGEGSGPPPGKSQVTICLLRNTNTEPLEKQLEVCTTLYVKR